MAVFDFLKRRFITFRRDALMLWYAFRDSRTPFVLKAASLLTALYLLSPFDLIPITIPILGVLDDLVIVPIAVSFLSKRLPDGVREDARIQADRWIARWVKRPLLAALVIFGVLLAVWAAVFYLLYRLLLG